MSSEVIGIRAESVPTRRMSWPVRSGAVPPLADSYYPRPETGLGLTDSLYPGETTVLADAESANGVAGAGGTGKTQLAAGLAHSLWRSRSVDLLVWVEGSSRDAIVTGYAQALAELGALEPGERPESAAARFIEWLGRTSRPWLVVIDDLADHRYLEGLWPRGAVGRVIVTTRGSGVGLAGQNRRIVPVGPFTRREAVNYLTAALKEDPDLRLGAPDLAEDLAFLPIGLAHATAVMASSGLDCREYRALFAERKQQFAGVSADDCPDAVLVTWSLAVDQAELVKPGGLTWPTLALAALLDPAGIPGSVLVTQAACSYVTGRHVTPSAADQAQVREAVAALASLRLLVVDPASSTRTVRVHPVIQRAVRSFLPQEARDQAGWAAASAVAQAWPQEDADPLLAQALRDCTARIRELTGELLWTAGCHPVLLRAGESLDNTGLAGPAVSYWQALIDSNSQNLGPDHPDTLAARDRLADSYERAGRIADAIPIYERALGDEDGAQPRAADTLAARANLARAYLAAGRIGDAITLHKRNLTEHERAHGPRHPDTLDARASLAECYRAAGQLKDAIPIYERTLADRERAQGPGHPDTLAARGNLAFAYRTAGRLRDAIPVYERTLADRERAQGSGHPDTMTARGNLASAYHSGRRLRDAIPAFERTLADRELVQGPLHPDTLTARGNLASAYHSARRLADAIPIYERTIADCEEVLGPDHPDTLTLRSNLAHAYHTAGRLSDAIGIFHRTLADCERVLGPDHPLTVTMRENFEAVSRV